MGSKDSYQKALKCRPITNPFLGGTGKVDEVSPFSFSRGGFLRAPPAPGTTKLAREDTGAWAAEGCLCFSKMCCVRPYCQVPVVARDVCLPVDS